MLSLSDGGTLVKMLTAVVVGYLTLVWNLTSARWECKGVGATVSLHHNVLLEQLHQERLTSACSISLSERLAWGVRPLGCRVPTPPPSCKKGDGQPTRGSAPQERARRSMMRG